MHFHKTLENLSCDQGLAGLAERQWVRFTFVVTRFCATDPRVGAERPRVAPRLRCSPWTVQGSPGGQNDQAWPPGSTRSRIDSRDRYGGRGMRLESTADAVRVRASRPPAGAGRVRPAGG